MSQQSRWPLVTVGIPAFQASTTIGRALQSVQRQSFTDFEVVIADDGSSDNLLEALRPYRSLRFRLLRNHRNLGLGHVRNQILNESRGRYLAWLDADDEMAPNRLARQIAELESTNSRVLCGSWIKSYYASHNVIRKLDLRRPWFPSGKPKIVRPVRSTGSLPHAQLFSNQVATSSCTIRLSVVRREGLKFCNKLAPAEDYDFWNRLLQFGHGLNIPTILTIRHQGAQSASTRNYLEQLEKLTDIWASLFELRGFPMFYFKANEHRSLCLSHSKAEDSSHFDLVMAWYETLISWGESLPQDQATRFGDVLHYYLARYVYRTHSYRLGEYALRTKQFRALKATASKSVKFWFREKSPWS